jgi:hypothetical protein
VITAVDTSVLIDVFRDDPKFGAASAKALRRCMKEAIAATADGMLWISNSFRV